MRLDIANSRGPLDQQESGRSLYSRRQWRLQLLGGSEFLFRSQKGRQRPHLSAQLECARSPTLRQPPRGERRALCQREEAGGPLRRTASSCWSADPTPKPGGLSLLQRRRAIRELDWRRRPDQQPLGNWIARQVPRDSVRRCRRHPASVSRRRRAAPAPAPRARCARLRRRRSGRASRRRSPPRARRRGDRVHPRAVRDRPCLRPPRGRARARARRTASARA